ncbi:MAG: accessory factor UbiK family protein [Sphingomonadaceae bacterium]|nr:accessory factor UbiK family protein [Sphingomonadaceae bacterium]
MQSQNRFFEDIAKLATGAAGTLAGVGREMEASMRQAFERMIGGMDLVSREEFEAVKAMAATARTEAEALKARLDALEARAAPVPPPHPATAEASKRTRRGAKSSIGDAIP